MPVAGRYSFPWIDVDDAVARLKKIREVSGGRVATREVAAQAMGMSERGGHTHNVIAAMADYGLLETGSHEVRITDLGEITIFGDANEANEAKQKAVKNIDIFRDLADKYGPRISEDQLKAFLRQNANIEIARLPQLTEQIGKLLNKNAAYLMSIEVRAAEGATSIAPTATPALGGGEVIKMSETPKDLLEVKVRENYVRYSLDDPELARTLAKASIDAIIDSIIKERKAKEAA